MAKSSRQKQKLLMILDLLMKKTDMEHSVTVHDILAHLESNGITAERKSIYDDLHVLEDYGLDICKTKSKTVGYYIGSRSFELPELKLLVDAVQSSKFITHKKSNELIKKLEGLSSEHDAKKLHRQVVVSNRVKAPNETIYYTIDSIHDAINKSCKVCFYYAKWEVCGTGNKKIVRTHRNNGELYKVSPWAMTWDDENYYMIAFDSKSGIIKHFRVDKIEKLKMLEDEKSDGRAEYKKFDMAVYSKRVFGMFGGEMQSVKLRVDNSLAGVIIDRFSKDVFVTVNGDGTFSVSVDVMLSPQFYGWLFALGDKVEILSPDSARDEFRRYLSKVVKKYDK